MKNSMFVPIKNRRSAVRFCAALGLLLCGCSSKTGDEVLDCFKTGSQTLSPVMTIDLEQYGIMLPTHVIKYHESFIIEKGSGKNVVDIITPSTGEVKHLFAKGRGPGEIITPSSLQLIGDKLYLYDITSQKYYSMDLKDVMAGKSVNPVVEYVFSGMAESGIIRPFMFYKTKAGLLSTGIYSANSWCVSINDDLNIMSSVPCLDYDSISALSPEARGVAHISSHFSLHPNGDKAVIAMQCAGAFSICDYSGGVLTETYRYQSKRQPKVGEPGMPGSPMIVYASDDISTFRGACSDNRHFYLLYSGKSIMAEGSPSDVARNLLVYDWKGKPVKRYDMTCEVSSIYLEDGMVYCATSYPEPRLIVYTLL